MCVCEERQACKGVRAVLGGMFRLIGPAVREEKTACAVQVCL